MDLEIDPSHQEDLMMDPCSDCGTMDCDGPRFIAACCEDSGLVGKYHLGTLELICEKCGDVVEIIAVARRFGVN